MVDPNRFVVVTGMSGAGKSHTLRFLEDLGYFCVDNLPAPLLPTFAELVRSPNQPRKRIAVCVDARAGEDLRNLPGYLDAVTELGIRPDTVFLDSSNQVLLQRYSETRRRHPSAPAGSIEDGIARERVLLEPIRARADLILDTSSLSVSDLRERVAACFVQSRELQELVVTITSFGFKYGVPPEADLVLDVRFLPNPHYDPDLRQRTGEDAEVRQYVLDNDDAREFLDRLRGLLKFLLPRYADEPKTYLTIAVGCTGGRHRSVTVAQEIALFLKQLGHTPRLRHRDIAKG